MAGLACELHGIASRQDDDDAEPVGFFELPSYAAAAAQYEEENGTAMSDEEETSAEADRRDSERRAKLAAGRRCWVLEEAEEEEEAWFWRYTAILFFSCRNLMAGTTGGASGNHGNRQRQTERPY